MERIFRPGAIGALMDEYERVAVELHNLLEALTQEEFIKILDPHTLDEDCRSIQSIMKHVVSAGYRYVDQIGKFLGFPPVERTIHIYNLVHAVEELDRMIIETDNTVIDHLEMTRDEIAATTQDTRWGRYNIEMMFEHAIVHILRHRRQIEKLLSTLHK